MQWPTVLVSKLEAPVIYPPEDRLLSGVHAGSTYQSFRNPDPDLAPEINVAVDRVAPVATGIAGLTRQSIYDYPGTGTNRRLLPWKLRTETELPAWQASDWTEFWIRGGEIAVNGRKAFANCFVAVEPGATVRIDSPFGAIALVWAEGRESWPARGADANLFGF